MNRDEKIAKKFIEFNLGENLHFEPDGNVPPDFSLDGDVGIEIRRLNHNHFGEDKIKGLEEFNVPFDQIIEEVLRSFDQSYNGITYALSFKYKRPIKNSFKKLKDNLNKVLEEFIQDPSDNSKEISIDQNISLTAQRRAPIKNKVFIHHLSSDRDFAGNILSIIKKNINHCIEEKEIKIKPYSGNYKKWYLILVNYILALESLRMDHQQILNSLNKKFLGLESSLFDKIYIIDRKNELILEINLSG